MRKIPVNSLKNLFSTNLEWKVIERQNYHKIYQKIWKMCENKISLNYMTVSSIHKIFGICQFIENFFGFYRWVATMRGPIEAENRCLGKHRKIPII